MCRKFLLQQGDSCWQIRIWQESRSWSMPVFRPDPEALSKAPSAGSAGDEKKTSERTLRDGAAIVSLPSADIPKRNLRELAESIADKKDGIDDVFQAGSEGWLMNQYILHYFNNKNAV